MDILTAVVLTCGVFSVVTGKIAARKRRAWPLWCVYGAVFGAVALLHVIVSPILEPCPSCGRNIRVRPGCRCKHCGWSAPPAVKSSEVASDVGGTVGFQPGDTLKAVDKKLDRLGCAYRMTLSPDTGKTEIICEARDVYGHPALVRASVSDDRIAGITVVYPSDPDYAIYYSLRTIFVSKYGKPDFEQLESGHSDRWDAKKTTLSLSTGVSADGVPATHIEYRRAAHD